MRIEYSRRFLKEYDKAPSGIQAAFKKRVRLFLTEKFHPLLRNHPLTGQYRGCRSINVTGDWRAIFEEHSGRAMVYFRMIGTHSQLYKMN
ncbi:MAG: type II toxin-antitoxin system mRNA interferase toxin, RelE/StbE family [Candidatus Magasanikbacteria bacterium]|nr:type II toxin-antitoxin system mRNA interferase toxin, RelE/StbE family [Candidatus Magasanikbacteria bacterium]